LARLWNSQGIASRFREGADDDGVLGPTGQVRLGVSFFVIYLEVHCEIFP
jgi:hypothetical protein